MTDVKDKVEKASVKDNSINEPKTEEFSECEDLSDLQDDSEIAPGEEGEIIAEISPDDPIVEEETEQTEQTGTPQLDDDADAFQDATSSSRSLKAMIETNVANYTIKYAPNVKPLTGVVPVCAIAIQWADGHGASVAKTGSAARKTAQVYENLSDGQYKWRVKTMGIKVPYNRSRKNLNKAEQLVKKIADSSNRGPKYGLYLIVNDNAKDFNNAGTDTAHISSPKVHTTEHESGHILGNSVKEKRYNLGHAGAYRDGKYEQYGDGLDFMSKYPAGTLNIVHQYVLGWIAWKGKVAQYDIGDPATVYKIDSLNAKISKEGAVRGVLVDRGPSEKQLFFSEMSMNGKPVYALHLRQGKDKDATGSARIALFAKKKTYDGLTFEVTTVNEETFVKISPEEPTASPKSTLKMQ